MPLISTQNPLAPLLRGTFRLVLDALFGKGNARLV